MARIRTIKPEFPQSESMGRVSREARYCFMLLWTIADDSGRLRGNSRMLASLLYPYDDDATELIDGWLAELSHEGCIDRYAVDGNTYIQVAKWLKHQRIDKPTASKLPEFIESSRILANPLEASRTEVEVEVEVEVDLGSGMDQEMEGKKHLSASPRVSKQDDQIFEEAWAAYPKRPNNSKTAALKAWTARVKNGVNPADMILGVKRYAKYCEAMRTEPNFIKQASTFFGPDQHYLNDFNAKPSTGMQTRESNRQAAYNEIFTPAIRQELTGQRHERSIN